MLLGVANGAAAPGESRAEAVGGEASPGGAGLWRRLEATSQAAMGAGSYGNDQWRNDNKDTDRCAETNKERCVDLEIGYHDNTAYRRRSNETNCQSFRDHDHAVAPPMTTTTFTTITTTTNDEHHVEDDDDIVSSLSSRRR